MKLLSRLFGRRDQPTPILVLGNDFRSAILPPLPHIRGLTLKRPQPDAVEILVGSATFEAFMELLLWLPFGFSLDFFDQYQNNRAGQESDPGAYVTVARRGSTYAYMTGNHGWSSRWTFQSRELLAAWLVLNLKPGGAQPDPLKQMKVRKLFHPPFDYWAEDESDT